MSWRWDVVGFTVSVVAAAANAYNAFRNVPKIPDGPLFYSLLATLQIGLAVWMWLLVRRHWRRLCDHRQAVRMNVRIVRAGVELPARLYHLGERHGMDVWVVIEPEVQPGDELLVDVLPAFSTIVGGFAGSADL